MFGKLKNKLLGSVNKVSGNTDFLEAVCAAAALTAAADGEISDSEVEMTVKTVSSNPTLSKAFSQREIEKTIDGMLKRVQAGRSGRMGLYKEIDDIAPNGEFAETVYLCALDVAESEGGIDEKEKEVLGKIASRLGVNPSSFDV